jgi:DNA-binding MarR family transcriptional regulator
MALPGMTDRNNAKRRIRFRQSELKALEKALRRIVRAHDLHSKALVKATGLTAAQLVIIKGIAELGEVTSTALSAYADISPATVVTVLDNLEERGIIQRYRSGQDRRIVHTRLTELGAGMLAQAPPPLGKVFSARLASLPEARRLELVAALTEFADMLMPSIAPAPVGTGPGIGEPTSLAGKSRPRV